MCVRAHDLLPPPPRSWRISWMQRPVAEYMRLNANRKNQTQVLNARITELVNQIYLRLICIDMQEFTHNKPMLNLVHRQLRQLRIARTMQKTHDLHALLTTKYIHLWIDWKCLAHRNEPQHLPNASKYGHSIHPWSKIPSYSHIRCIEHCLRK